MTDDWKSYAGLAKEFAGHEVVCHGTGEYARTREDRMSVNTNTRTVCEVFFWRYANPLFTVTYEPFEKGDWAWFKLGHFRVTVDGE